MRKTKGPQGNAEEKEEPFEVMQQAGVKSDTLCKIW